MIDTRYEPDRSRLQLDASRELRDILEEVASKRGVSVRALVLYSLADQSPRIREQLAKEGIRKNYGAVKRIKENRQ